MAVEKIKLVPEVPTTAGEYERKRNSDGTTGWADKTPQPTLTYSCDPGLGVYAKVNNNLVLSGTKLPLGTEVTLTVVDFGAQLNTWSDGSSAYERTITMTDDVDIHAEASTTIYSPSKVYFVKDGTALPEISTTPVRATYSNEIWYNVGTVRALLQYPDQISFDNGNTWLTFNGEIEECSEYLVIHAEGISNNVSATKFGHTAISDVAYLDPFKSTSSVNAYLCGNGGLRRLKGSNIEYVYSDSSSYPSAENLYLDEDLTTKVSSVCSTLSVKVTDETELIPFRASSGRTGDYGAPEPYVVTNGSGDTVIECGIARPGDVLIESSSLDVKIYEIDAHPYSSSFDHGTSSVAVGAPENVGMSLNPSISYLYNYPFKVNDGTSDVVLQAYQGDVPDNVPYKATWRRVAGDSITDRTICDSPAPNKNTRYFKVDDSVDPPAITEITTWKFVDMPRFKGIKVNLLPNSEAFSSVLMNSGDQGAPIPLTSERWMKIGSYTSTITANPKIPGTVTWSAYDQGGYAYLDEAAMSEPGMLELTATWSAPSGAAATVDWNVSSGGTIAAYDVAGNLITSPHSCVVGDLIRFVPTPDAGKHMSSYPDVNGGWYYVRGDDTINFFWNNV